MLTDYVTFVAAQDEWRVYRAVGTAGSIISRRNAVFPVFDFSAARQPYFWVSGNEQVKCYDFAKLAEVSLPAPEGRITAVAAGPDQFTAVALRIPSTPDASVTLLRGDASGWSPLKCNVTPDISSRLAWINRRYIAYESASRFLCVLDVDTGQAQAGPPGSSPTGQADGAAWYAIVAGQIVRFPTQDPFRADPVPVGAYDLKNPQRFWVSNDGSVFTWIEPFRLYRNRGFVQQQGKKALEIADWSDSPVFVAGPYSL